MHTQQAQVQTLLDSLNQSDAERLADAGKRLETSISRFQRLERDAQNLLGDISVHGVAHNHSLEETRERDTADRLRRGAIICAVLTILALLSIPFLLQGNTVWQSSIAHVTAILGLGGLAAYFGRQSAEHRREERGLRDTRLRMASIAIWLDDLPDKDRSRIKQELVEPFFLSPTPERSVVTSGAYSPVPAARIVEVLGWRRRSPVTNESSEVGDLDAKP